MPFGLRNAGATYQRLVDKAFYKQIGRNLKVYVDDLVIKSCTEDEIVRDMEETFQTLREINMKLNPKKCTFGIEEGMFLGYKVSTRGLKVCPGKVDVVLSLPSPKCLKDVQRLNGKLALDYGSGRSVQANKATHFRTTYVSRTNGKRGAYSLSGGSKRNDPPRVSIKGQILADFIVKRPEEESPDTLMGEEEELPEPWILFDATNNEAEYEALISGLKIAEQMGVKNLQANVDSRLVANQVPRRENKKEDALSKITSISFAHLSKQVLVEELKEKSISVVEVLAVVEEEGDTWMTPIFKYLMDGTLPVEVKKLRAVKRKSWRFSIKWDTLQKIFLRTMAAMCRTTPSQLCSKRDT
ncbi:reverse transcriptase domain-containing protein [Tanacetum coccineum]